MALLPILGLRAIWKLIWRAIGLPRGSPDLEGGIVTRLV